MRSYLLGLALTTGSLASGLLERQVGIDQAPSPSTFVRRGLHGSTVAKNKVFIDGGEISSRAENGTISFGYSTSFEVIDLSNDWTNSTLQIQSIPKPSDVPDLVKAGLWYDPAADTLYSGFAGRSSYIGNATGQIPDYPLGVWQYGPVSSDSATFRSTLASTDALWDSLIRPCSELITYTGIKGYVIGGADALDVRDDYTPAIDGILEFDFRTKTLMNVTIQGTLFDAGIHTAGVLFIPDFGSQGIIIVVGGEDAAINLVPMDSVSIMDVASGQWYIQKVGGTIPRPRKNQCIAGVRSAEGSFEIIMYGGWSGHATAANTPFDEIFVLSLPAFTRSKVDYTPQHPRHALTCHAVGGGQILTIGGLDSDNTEDNANAYLSVFSSPDPFAQGLGVFDLGTLSWKDHYSANPREYQQADLIKNIYSSRNVTAFANTEVRALFSNSTILSSSSPHKSNTGAIAGGVVGGVVGLVLIAGLALWLWRRRRQRTAATTNYGASTVPGHPNEYQDRELVYEVAEKNSKEHLPHAPAVYQQRPVHELS